MVARTARRRAIGRIGTAARVACGLAFLAVAVGWFGAAGHLVTVGIVLALLSAFPGESVLLFYGSTMLVAAASGNGGCEVTAVSNWLRGRDDQVGCPLFAPFDALDRARAGRPADDGCP